MTTLIGRQLLSQAKSWQRAARCQAVLGRGSLSQVRGISSVPASADSSFSRHGLAPFVGALLASVAAANVNEREFTSRCDAAGKAKPAKCVSEEQVDALVTELLKDPSINMTLVPDAIEGQLYKSTILLTLNAIYSNVLNLDGTRVLSHELELSTTKVPPSSWESAEQGSVNDEVLRHVVDRLLANPAVNSSLIPDAVERQIYESCLKVVFKTLQIVLDNLRVQICGHDLTLELKPHRSGAQGGTIEVLAEAAMAVVDQEGDEKTGASTKHRLTATPIDMELLRKFARNSGVDDETNNDYWWKRIFTKADFVARLHAALYGLILGIVDDLLNSLELQVLDSVIQLDLVPARTPPPEEDEEETPSKQSENVSIESFAAASFAAGMGVGVTLMAVLSHTQR